MKKQDTQGHIWLNNRNWSNFQFVEPLKWKPSIRLLWETLSDIFFLYIIQMPPFLHSISLPFKLLFFKCYETTKGWGEQGSMIEN